MLPTFSKDFKGGSSPPVSGADRSARGAEAVPDPSGKNRDIRYVLSVIIFSLTIAGSIGMYGANAVFDRNIRAVESSISANNDVIRPNEIMNFIDIDRSIRLLKDVDVARGAHSLLLDEISKIVLPGVRYTSATISSDPSSGMYSVSVSGSANSIPSYIHQIRERMTVAGEPVLFDNYSVQGGSGEEGEPREGRTVSFTFSVDVPASAFIVSSDPEEAQPQSQEIVPQ